MLDAQRACGVDLDAGVHCGEGLGPVVEVEGAGGLEEVGAQVLGHDPHLAEGVGDRGCGGEGGDTVAVGATQVVELHLQIEALFGSA